jgi:2-polyprenyl-6-methoxyphenol hydroxylase-like FAD-dependent oxidoreductase
VDAIIDTLDRGDLLCTPIKEYLPARLVSGRIALVGDAAHVATPMTGQGFTAALEDAVALAASLRGSGSASAADALAHYERQRLQVTRRLVLSGQQFSRSFAGA